MSAPPDKDSEITVFSRAYYPAVFYPYKLSSIQKTNHTTDKKRKNETRKKKDCMDVSPVIKQDAISMTFLSAVGKKMEKYFLLLIMYNNLNS